MINVQGNGNEAPVNGNPAPYVQQWNFDIQRQFPGNLLFDIAYAGSKGTHLPMHDQTLNQLQPQFLPKSAADVANLKLQVPNPFAGNCTGCTGPVQSGGVGTNPKVMAAQLLLPFPQFDNVAMAEPDNRNSIYHSMQMKVEKRFAAGAQILASYTVAKLIDNTNSEINWLEASPVGWNDANVYNLRGERSLDAFDVSQHLVLASVLDLPASIPSSPSNAASRLSSAGARACSAIPVSRTWAVPAIPERPCRSRLPALWINGWPTGLTLPYSRIPTITATAPIRVPSRTYALTG